MTHNPPPYRERPGLDLLISVIKESPLPEEVKQESILVLEEKAEEVDRLVREVQWKAPETNYAGLITFEIMRKYLGPVFEPYDVPQPIGRNVSKLIYQEIFDRSYPHITDPIEPQFETIKS